MLAKVPLELDEYLWAQWKCSLAAHLRTARLWQIRVRAPYARRQCMDVLSEVDAASLTDYVTQASAEARRCPCPDNIDAFPTTSTRGAQRAVSPLLCCRHAFVFSRAHAGLAHPSLPRASFSLSRRTTSSSRHRHRPPAVGKQVGFLRRSSSSAKWRTPPNATPSLHRRQLRR